MSLSLSQISPFQQLTSFTILPSPPSPLIKSTCMYSSSYLLEIMKRSIAMTIPIASSNASTPPAVADAISTVSVLAGETMHVYMLIF